MDADEADADNNEGGNDDGETANLQLCWVVVVSANNVPGNEMVTDCDTEDVNELFVNVKTGCETDGGGEDDDDTTISCLSVNTFVQIECLSGISKDASEVLTLSLREASSAASLGNV